jgi:hypothetical protein
LDESKRLRNFIFHNRVLEDSGGTLPSVGRDRKTGRHESLGEIDFDIRNIDAQNLRNNPSGLEDGVGRGNSGI